MGEQSAEYKRAWWQANKAKAAEYRAKRRREHGEELKAYQHKYHQNHKATRESQISEWWKAHPGIAARYCKVWRERHPERAEQDSQNARLRMRNLRVNNPEAVRERERKWTRANPERVARYRHDRRARLAGAGGTYTVDEWKQRCAEYGNRCACCGKSDAKLTVDHIVPITRGGSNFIENLQPLCRSCNASKSTKTIFYAKEGATTIHGTPQGVMR